MIECGLLSGLFLRRFQRPLAGTVICKKAPHMCPYFCNPQLLSGIPASDHFNHLPVRPLPSHISFADIKFAIALGHGLEATSAILSFSCFTSP